MKPSSSERNIASKTHFWRAWVGVAQFSLLAGLALILYWGTLGRLLAQWATDPNYSHGFLVPLFAGLVICRKKEALVGLPAEPQWWGLAVIAVAMGELVLGIYGAENFLSRSSLVLLLGGLVLYFRGWRFFRALLFPWSVLFLMIPIPAIIFYRIALPLQFLASRLAGCLLEISGVPVLREGNILQLPSITLDVVEACSGIRSLVSLMTLAVFYGYFAEPRVFRRTLLLLAAIPIAVFANAMRIAGSGMAGEYWSPEKAEGFFHLFSGWLIFAVSLGMLMLIHFGASKIGERTTGKES